MPSHASGPTVEMRARAGSKVPRAASDPGAPLALLAAAFSGDRGAARDLTEQILLPLLDAAVSRMLIGSRAERFEKADVIQEVFQHLYQDDWRRLRSYDAARGSLATYVWTLARSWLRDHGRRLPPPRPMEDMESEASPDSGPDGKAALGQIVERLQKELNDEELALFQWIHLEGASRAAVAARLQIDLEAVHKRVSRLEKKIRAVVSDRTPQETEKGGKP